MLSRLALPAAWLLLLGAASASPAPAKTPSTQTATATDLIVTVDAAGVTRTIAPKAAGATASPAAVNATDSTTACHNPDGEFKPFCLPKDKDVYYPDTTHYVTWDPTFFQATHGNGTTLQVIGFYTNNETKFPLSGPPGEEEEAFTSEHIAAAWGFYQWRLPKSLLTKQSAKAVNITLRLVALPTDGQPAQWRTGPTVTLEYKPKKSKGPTHKEKGVDEHALYVVLPLLFSVTMLMVAATFFFNRGARRIDIGNIARGRRGGGSRRKGLAVGSGASKKDRARNKEQSIRLMERAGGSEDTDDEGGNWEAGWRPEASGRDGGRVDRKRD
ncbi:hypothetical protein C8A05DRAFT_46202 [Staphylotrichum tortipilum]|uniref:Uncharacterized protein n=1 Tax=Staphylotrichum tortipilum TaxID=2831512 RepID=A0AAN6RRI4_9PEZI|nr:hypothetical protein C8A05DRAFT_46202 [Staphylotrichum longicolle]